MTLDNQQATGGIAIDKYDNIWTISDAHIFEYARLPADARGSITLDPVRTIGGPKTRLGGGALKIDPKSGYLYTSTETNVLGFDPNVGGNVAPVINLTGKNHQFNFPHTIWDFTVDYKGRVLVSTDSQLFRFAPLASGNVAPISALDFAHCCFYKFETDAQDNIYALGVGDLVEFASSASGRDRPIQRRPVKPLEGFYPFTIH